MTVVLACACSGFCSCTLQPMDESAESIDETMAQLYVANFDGGFGNEWINKVKARFEAKYGDTVFYEGTKGVQIIIDNAKTSGSSLINQLSSQPQDVFFTEQGFYLDAVNQNKFLDITDIVREDLTDEYGESGSIYDKLNESQKSFYEVNGKIYALPHYSCYSGFTYDIDLFEENNLYYAESPTTANGLVTSAGQARSAGPDGVKGTSDDGLPATYDEFFALCDVMVKKNITPFVWSGMVRGGYLNFLLTALYADYEGEADTLLNFELDGRECEDLVKDLVVDASGKITSIEFEEPTAIDKTNGYLLYKQAGRAYALSFLRRMLSNSSYYHGSAIDESVSHLEAQYNYLKSSLMNEPIAFFVDGIYWDNEAQAAGSYSQLVSIYGEDAARENRNFGFLPMPKASADRASGATLFDYIYSMAFISANIDAKKVELAKTFLQFCYTDESLVEFTLTTNTPRALDYELSEEQLGSMSAFGRSVMALKNAESTKVVYPYGKSRLFLNNQQAFNLIEQWTSVVDGKSKTYAVDAFRKEKISARDYFIGMQAMHTKAVWDSTFSKYYD